MNFLISRAVVLGEILGVKLVDVIENERFNERRHSGSTRILSHPLETAVPNKREKKKRFIDNLKKVSEVSLFPLRT